MTKSNNSGDKTPLYGMMYIHRLKIGYTSLFIAHLCNIMYLIKLISLFLFQNRKMNWISFLLFTTSALLIAAQQKDDVETEPSDVQPENALPVAASAPANSFHAPSSALDDCDPDMIGFELITGFVFSAPGSALDSIPALMLTECLETCQGNDSCQSVNYETGLCILFSSNADALPGEYNLLYTIILKVYCCVSYRR